MKKQHELTSEQQAAIVCAMAAQLMKTGEPRYDSEGDRDGLHEPITAGTIRHGRNGAPWASWNAIRWYRMMDWGTAGGGQEPYEDSFSIVCDDDGRPLGSNADGPLVMLHRKIRGHWVAVQINTGWNAVDEIAWE